MRSPRAIRRCFIIMGCVGAMFACGQPPAQTSETGEADGLREAGMGQFEYMACDGGPHIVIPVSVGGRWRGVFGRDYARAGSVPEPFGFVAVGDQSALVLTNPELSAWAPSPAGEGEVDIFILRAWKTDPDDVIRRAQAWSVGKMTDTYHAWKLKSAEVSLLYAGDVPGKSPVYGEIKIPIAAGTYRLFSAEYKKPSVGEVIMIRLKAEQKK